MPRPRKLIPQALDLIPGTYSNGTKSYEVLVLVVEHEKGVVHIPLGPETARTLSEVLATEVANITPTEEPPAA